MHNKTEEEILQERVYGKAAVATQEDEENDEYDDFHQELPFPTNKGFLEYNNRSFNLSPVSALTTGSYLKDAAHEAEGEDIIEPRKGLHTAGFAKRLPLEDGFDSGDEDDDTPVPQDEGTENESEHQDLYDRLDESDEYNTNGGDAKSAALPPPPELTSTSPKLTKNLDSSNSSELHMSNGSFSVSQQSFQGEEGGVVNPRTGKSKSRASKPVIRVDGDVVQDKYGDGGIYTGTIGVDNRLPHGYGQMQYDNERQYEGEWKGGRWHGYGRWVNPNGDCYEG